MADNASSAPGNINTDAINAFKQEAVSAYEYNHKDEVNGLYKELQDRVEDAATSEFIL